MSVDTNTKGKSLGSYRRVSRDGVELLLAPKLAQYATTVRLDARRKLLRTGFVVQLHGDDAGSCQI